MVRTGHTDEPDLCIVHCSGPGLLSGFDEQVLHLLNVMEGGFSVP